MEVMFNYNPGHQDSRAVPMGANILSVKFITPRALPTGGAGGKISVTKDTGVQADIEGCLSLTAGDFENPIQLEDEHGVPTGVVAPTAKTQPAQTITTKFGPVNAVPLKSDTTYFYNVRGGVEGFVARVSLSAR